MIAVTFMVCAFTILSVSQLDPGHEVQYSDRGPFNRQSGRCGCRKRGAGWRSNVSPHDASTFERNFEEEIQSIRRNHRIVFGSEWFPTCHLSAYQRRLLRRSQCLCLDNLHHATNALSNHPAEDVHLVCGLLFLFSH